MLAVVGLRCLYKVRVGKADVLEADERLGGLRGQVGKHLRTDFREVKHRTDTVRGSAGLRVHDEDSVDAEHRTENQVEINEERDDDTGLDAALVHAVRAVEDDKYQTDVQKQVHQRVRQRHRRAGLEIRAGEFVVDLVVTGLLILFTGECLYDADACDIFPKNARQAVDVLLNGVIKRNAVARDEKHDACHQRYHQKEYHGQLHIKKHRHDDAAGQKDRRADAHSLDHADEVLYVVAVRSHAGDQGRKGDAVKLRAGKPCCNREQVAAKVVRAVSGDSGCPLVGVDVELADEDGAENHEGTE